MPNSLRRSIVNGMHSIINTIEERPRPIKRNSSGICIASIVVAVSSALNNGVCALLNLSALSKYSIGIVRRRIIPCICGSVLVMKRKSTYIIPCVHWLEQKIDFLHDSTRNVSMEHKIVCITQQDGVFDPLHGRGLISRDIDPANIVSSKIYRETDIDSGHLSANESFDR